MPEEDTLWSAAAVEVEVDIPGCGAGVPAAAALLGGLATQPGAAVTRADMDADAGEEWSPHPIFSYLAAELRRPYVVYILTTNSYVA